jgi:hypothetical protein
MINKDPNNPNKYLLKLSDFGWACKYNNEKRKTLCGTPECIFNYNAT